MDGSEKSKEKIYYGWVITGVVFLNLSIAYGAQYSFGILVPSLIGEFHWSRQSVAGAFSLYNFMYSILAVGLGRYTDRFGPRIILIFGSMLLGGGIALISIVQEPWHLYVIYGLLASWGMSAAYITSNPTVVKWFVRKRGLALGLSQSGMGVGIILVPPITGMIITAFGWRPTCVILGGIVFVVLFAMAFFLVGYPEEMGLQPDGRRLKSEEAAPLPVIREITWSAEEAIRTRSFWVLTATYFLHWLFVFFPLVHLVIFTMDIGLSKEIAILALSVLGGASTLGRLVMGFTSDRVGRKPALMINLAIQTLSWLWIAGTSTGWMLFLFALSFGFSYGGASTLFPAITGDFFGRLRVASVIGAIFTVAGVSSAIGPLAGGYIYDATHSYRLAFLLGAVTNLMALGLISIAKPPVKPARGKG